MPRLLHTVLAQSLAELHFFPSAHFAQLPPPQSTSASAPFKTPSEQLAD
jgi:hypothetical protein